MQDNRQVLVQPERLVGWVERFGERNGNFSVEAAGAVVVLRAINGCTAELTAPLCLVVENGPPDVSDEQTAVDALIQAASIPATLGLLLIRRGGYAVGVSRNGKLVASKTGTRYVQSRTAAGGWSQQRFARRRANQADALVETTVDRAQAIFEGHRLDAVQAGGDAPLVADCLGHPRLNRYRKLPALPLLTVPDPRREVLVKAAADARAVRVRLTGIPVS
ncbi:acVLRF1 family peptidyl-tRNA hydrolase [Arthrobacter tecti]